ncbi:hypothetical protein LA080_015203 [Diaporthe eres]|nr:hypothetical protein LA080_015203 [Diaporthe eres]
MRRRTRAHVEDLEQERVDNDRPAVRSYAVECGGCRWDVLCHFRITCEAHPSSGPSHGELFHVRISRTVPTGRSHVLTPGIKTLASHESSGRECSVPGSSGPPCYLLDDGQEGAHVHRNPAPIVGEYRTALTS